MEIVLAVCAGICLAAAAGFRVFVPMFALSLAARFLDLPLSAEFAWLDSPVTLIVLSVATLAEILAYYVPWFDHLLDAIAGPLAVFAGVAVMAAVMVDLPPVVRWLLALLVGGGTAGTVKLGAAAVRGASTATTAGAGNPVVATAEVGGSVTASFLGLVLPLAGAFLLGLLAFALARRIGRLRRRRRTLAKQSPG